MNIVYACDDNFVHILGISIISLLECNKDQNLIIYILSDNIGVENQKMLRDIVENYQKTIIMIPVNINEFSRVELDALSWSKSAFSRMFLGTILEQYHVDRTIYLDCDTIINQSLEELWNFNLQDKTIGMVVDPVCTKHKKNIGLKEENPYYNSGVLLVDMEKWKTNQCEKKLQDFAYEKNGKTPYVDQGLINGALQSYICTLPLKFNVITVFFDYSYREILRYRKPSGFFYSEEEVTNAVTAPCIIHYTKSIFTERPWILNSTHKKKDLWEKNKQISPWKDMEPSDCTIHGIKKLYVEISRRLPRNLSIMLQSFLHTVVKPYVDVH